MVAKCKEKKEVANLKAEVLFHMFIFTATSNPEGREELNRENVAA